MNKLNLFLATLFVFSVSGPALAQMTVPGSAIEDTTKINASDAQLEVPADAYSEAYALAKGNNNVTKIEIDEDWVRVSYKYKTKMLWFIPVNVILKASANLEEKQLQLGRPWWSLFTPVPTGKIKSTLQTDFDKIEFTSNKIANQTKVMKAMVSAISRAQLN